MTPPNFSPRIRSKVERAVELLQKAEKTALLYDPADGYYLAFSGGKDSQTLYHVAKLAGVRFKAHMSLTSVDPPEVIRFVKRNYPDVVRHAPKESIYTICVRKGILPTMRVRWCCKELKEGAGAGKVTLLGIRRAESVRRAKRGEVGTKSKRFAGGTWEEFQQWRGIDGDTPDEATGTQARCIHGKDSILLSPLIDWEDRDVWEFLGALGVEHCELYDQGIPRIGCISCPMSTPRKRRAEAERWPHCKRGWLRALSLIRARWRAEGKTGRKLMGDEKRNRFFPKWKNSYIIDALWVSPDNTAPTEEEVVEGIFSWWISGKPHARWYADTYKQQRLEFKQ